MAVKETITVCVKSSFTTYEEALEHLEKGVKDRGIVASELVDFLALCVRKLGLPDSTIPENGGEVRVDELHLSVNPEIAIISMNPAKPNFRDVIIQLAQEKRLVALDHQNGYLFIPGESRERPWWKFW